MHDLEVVGRAVTGWIIANSRMDKRKSCFIVLFFIDRIID